MRNEIYQNMSKEDKIADITQHVNYIKAQLKMLINGLGSEENKIIDSAELINYIIPIEERVEQITKKLEKFRSEI